MIPRSSTGPTTCTSADRSWCGSLAPSEAPGFAEASRLLESKVTRLNKSVYDLDPESEGRFDVVLCGTLLEHLQNPVRALEAMREVCSGELLLIDQVSPPGPARARDAGGATAQAADEWWTPNTAGMVQMVTIAGFEVTWVSKHFLLPPGPGAPSNWKFSRLGALLAGRPFAGPALPSAPCAPSAAATQPVKAAISGGRLGRDRMVSVIVPTYHRSQRLAMAVASVLSQQLPEGHSLEVVIAVSDAGNRRTLRQHLSAGGGRSRPNGHRCKHGGRELATPASARRPAHCWHFLDDDCVAPSRAGLPRALQRWVRPTWSGSHGTGGGPRCRRRTTASGRSSILALGIVQPARPPREAIERAGLFDDDWNPSGRAGDHFGKDASGAGGWCCGRTSGFRPAAVVHHAVETSRPWWLPQLPRQGPALSASFSVHTRGRRRHFYLGYFVNRRHLVWLTASASDVDPGAAVSRCSGRRGHLPSGREPRGWRAYLSPFEILPLRSHRGWDIATSGRRWNSRPRLRLGAPETSAVDSRRLRCASCADDSRLLAVR